MSDFLNQCAKGYQNIKQNSSENIFCSTPNLLTLESLASSPLRLLMFRVCRLSQSVWNNLICWRLTFWTYFHMCRADWLLTFDFEINKNYLLLKFSSSLSVNKRPMGHITHQKDHFLAKNKSLLLQSYDYTSMQSN